MRRLLSSLLLSALLTGFVTGSLVRTGFCLPPANGLAFVSPVTTVAVSRNFSPAIADKAATLESARLLSLTLLQHRAELRLRNEVTIPDSLLLQARHEIYQAVLGIEAHWQLASGAHLPVLDYLLAQQRQRYALLTVASGRTYLPKLPPPVLTGLPCLGAVTPPPRPGSPNPTSSCSSTTSSTPSSTTATRRPWPPTSPWMASPCSGILPSSSKKTFGLSSGIKAAFRSKKNAAPAETPALSRPQTGSPASETAAA